jgi:hypothetical protein
VRTPLDDLDLGKDDRLVSVVTGDRSVAATNEERANEGVYATNAARVRRQRACERGWQAQSFTEFLNL